MASYGQPSRNRPALYKPTDFGSHQRRISASSASEIKKEEPQVIVKIQQRPQHSIEGQREEEEKPANIVSILKVEEMSDAKEVTADEQKPTGVAEKDLDKIQKLKEFMAKQQEAAMSKEIPVKDKKIGTSTNGKRDGDHQQHSRDVKENKDGRSGRASTNRRQRQSGSPTKSKIPEKDSAQSSKKDIKDDAACKSTGARTKSKNVREGNKGVGNQKSTNNKIPDGQNRNQTASSSYYVHGRPTHAMPPWIGGPVVNNPGILKRPELVHQGPGQVPQYSQRTAPATKDKTELKRSLDFVKNFFDTDPEVLYHRKQNADIKTTKTELAAAGVHGQSTLPAQLSTTSDLNSVLTQPMYNTSLQDSHRPVSMTHNAAQLQSLMAAQNLAAGLPSSYSSIYHQQPNASFSHANVGIGNAAGGLYSNTSQHHNTSPGTIHHGVSQGSLHSTSHGSLHQSGSSSNYHGSSGSYHAINHPNSMFQHQNAGGYPELYSQMAPSTLLSPGSNYPDSISSNVLTGGSGYSTYSGYFPTGNHQSHIRHATQELDPGTMQNILHEVQAKQSKWQKKALTKCGPIDSKQARSLIEQLIDGTYECMVCCESVKWSNQVWNCTNCHHIFHLSCIRKWAKSEAAAVKDESGWRCPGCQNVSTRPPNKYFCFCGKVRDPDWNPRDGITPHSCGEVCKKKRVNPSCEHNCKELCHPGPCPSCPVMVTKYCPCGKTTSKTRCGQIGIIKCKSTCSKQLSCGQHQCQKICHEGPCEVCETQHAEECYCSKEKHYVLCGTGEVINDSKPSAEEICNSKYSCKQTCDRVLSCGNHKCEAVCHPGPCKDCPLLPGNTNFCPCGKVSVNVLSNEKRTSCLDPIPTCEGFCGRKLQCGPKGSSHLCMMKCHIGKCRPCQKVTSVQCRCGSTKKDISCKELKPDELTLCERKCNKKRKCGRHKCNQKCCIDRDHSCYIICGKKLSCGLHKCDEVCHTGFCPACWRAGFDELSCHCQATVLFPPIPCGSKPPDCDQPCSRHHPCGHKPLHTCHSDESCPPCTVLTTKQCMGGHEMRKNIPCHLAEVSCGRKCGKVLSCKVHSCIKKCHKGVCLETEDTCTQPCSQKRRDCSHPCAASCHIGKECPIHPCKAQVKISCRCGRRSANALCLANANSAYLSLNAEILSSQLRNLQSGQSIDLNSLGNADKRPKFLECDEECAVIARNKRLAEALGIENPDGGHFQNITFSPTLRQEAKDNYPFVQMLENVLQTLVLNAKKSSQGQVHHSLPSMNSSQRKIVHELAEVYGCKTYSQDAEPKRNTVIMATKDSITPNTKLSILIERELMKPNPPLPVMLSQSDNAIVLGSAVTLKPILKNPNATARVDYFDDDCVE